MNHLLKAPWAVHPKTGRVCIPMDPADAHSFNPLDTPTLSRCLGEINAFDKKNPGNGLPDVEKTSLAAPLAVMKTMLKSMDEEVRLERKRAAASAGVAASMEF